MDTKGKRCPTRRAVLDSAVALAVASPLRVLGQTSGKPERLRPQPGDRLVFAQGDHEGESISAEAVVFGAEPIPALPQEAESGVVRSGSRLNRVMVMRLDPAALSPVTARSAAEGIVVYSAVCTHTGCDVSDWNEETGRLVCPCHETEFEVIDGGKVMDGPAPKPLAMLPIEIADGELRVTRPFTRRVGFQRQ